MGPLVARAKISTQLASGAYGKKRIRVLLSQWDEDDIDGKMLTDSENITIFIISRDSEIYRDAMPSRR